jgi:transcriptional regulator with XRE-family HTH domain
VRVIEFARREKGWSQLELGNLPTVKISQNFISMIERGQGLPTPEQRERIARALGVPPAKLLDHVEITALVTAEDRA